MGQGYHYKVSCLDCRKSYHVERCKEIYEKVKDLPWLKSKKTIKHIAKANILSFL